MNNPHDYEDLFEVEQKDGKHPLNNKSSNEVADRIKKTGLILVIVLGLILGCGAMAFSWVRSKLHTAPVEQNIESERKIMDAPENIGKPKTPPPTPVSENNQAEEKPQDSKLPEPTETVAVTASNTPPENSENKPPSLKDRRLAGGDMQTNPQNATQQAAAVSVRVLKNMDLTLLKGTKIPCVLENNIVSEQDGFTSCVVSHDIYSGNAKTLLIEKGSKVTGMYSGSVKNGNTRLQIIWDRIITPYDLAIDLNSPSTDRLGASGVTGKVDNRWGLRIGSALLVSLISDTMEVIADRNKKSTVFVDSETADTSQDIAEKVLDQYINLPPIIYIEEGKTIQIYAQQDIDFSSVYRLKKTRFHF
ncbi:MAG: TrbI/VirB10 family protein [Neisseriaceae bacterium]|nr:TrbI/VirB10 family protein [Neisseriaceae bacterium]